MIEIIQDPGVKKFLPGVQEFLTQGSPRSHYMRIRCPVFLFHAKDDSNEPFASSARFARLMRMSSLRCDFVTVKTGNHYQSMIDQGIPRGIEWLKEIERGSSTD
jgi:dipeptidyl aminopeptidase/acylaminoacyl peptidase